MWMIADLWSSLLEDFVGVRNLCRLQEMLKYLEQIHEGFQISQSHQAQKNTWKYEEHLDIMFLYNCFQRWG